MNKVLSDWLGIKNWDDKKQCWIGVVCRIEVDDKGEEGIVVADVGSAQTQVEIDDWIGKSLAEKPWERLG